MMVAFASMRCDSKPIPKIEQPWPMHHIDRQFYNHNSLGPGDVDQDGHEDYSLVQKCCNIAPKQNASQLI